MSLNRLAVRSLRARPLRATLSILGVALGVAVLFAGLATNAGVEASVRSTVHDLVGRADLRVAAFGETGLSPETVAAIAGTPGVAVAAPALEQRTYLGSDLAAGDALPPPVTVLGIDPTVDGQLHDLALVDGSPLRDPAEQSALITERLAAQDGLAIGSPLTMQGAGDGITYRVVGIIRGDGPADRRLRPDGRRPAGHRAAGLRRDRRDPRRHRPDRPGQPGGRVRPARVAAQDPAVRAVLAAGPRRRACAARPRISRRRPRSSPRSPCSRARS